MNRHDPILDDGNEEKILEDQLRSTLRQDLARALQIKRPVLTHLNADTTWLLSIPVPEHAQPTRNKKRKRDDASQEDLEGEDGTPGTADPTAHSKQFFHILIDPWLRGSQSDVAHFFSQQWHAHDSAVQTISEVEEAIREMEDLASPHGGALPATSPSSTPPSSPGPQVAIDAVIVSHEFTDHMHKETLLEVPACVPVFASYKAVSIIESWQHFDVVVTLLPPPPANSSGEKADWRATSVDPLPSWIGISRLGEDKIDLLYYHSAVMIAFSSGSVDGDRDAEAVIYTPHGITPSDLHPLPLSPSPSHPHSHSTTTPPRIRILALLHGLHDVRLGGRRAQLNLGAHNGLRVQRLTRAKYWVGTHDEVKRGGGIVSWFLKRTVYTVREAVERAVGEEMGGLVKGLGNGGKGLGSGQRGSEEGGEGEEGEEGQEGQGEEDEGEGEEEDVRFVELGNGESLVLE